MKDAIDVLLAHLIFTVALAIANPTAAVPLSDVVAGGGAVVVPPPPPHAVMMNAVSKAVIYLLKILSGISTSMIE